MEHLATYQTNSVGCLEAHPDIFTDAMAAYYLHLKGSRSMDTILQRYKIAPIDLPGERLWHRQDLEDVVRQARAKSSNKRGRGRDTKLQIGDMAS